MADPKLLDSVAAEPVIPTVQPVKSRSPTQIALERLRADKIAMVCALIVLVFVLIALFADIITKITGTDPYTTNLDLIDATTYPTVGTSAEHPFGLEPRLGRDLFARWVHGVRYSLMVAVGATVLTTFIGTILGLIAGFAGGWVDRGISWVVDFVLSLPFLLLAIAIAPVVDTYFQDADSQTQGRVRIFTVITILTIFGWAGLARLIRGEVLSLREREFIQAARAIGVPTRRILFRELLPNLGGPIIVSFSLTLPAYIAFEAGLSYLGVGLTEPTPSWGRTINDALSYYSTYPEYLWQPVFGIMILVLSLNLLGDAVRDAFDPRTRR
jgi:ABC-type dipeptide/oligopeptide/nickel transport system permease subunit